MKIQSGEALAAAVLTPLAVVTSSAKALSHVLW